ncbi:MAG: hypothetical protein QXW91_01275 [Candidatus Nitrosotenuis sp.]
MAKIRLKLGENEVEIESRDFYIDNDTAKQVIVDIAQTLDDNKARVVESTYSTQAESGSRQTGYLGMLNDAEFHEPEFTQPIPISDNEIPQKIDVLEKDYFFSKPRTVMETVERLRDHGWLASPLAVSKVLTKRAFQKSLAKNTLENKVCYFKEEQLKH